MNGQNEEEEKKKFKRPRHMRWYPEKWLDGSIRDQFTAAQRGVWADLLSMGGRNDPPGQVDFTTIRSLARRLRISPKLLTGTLAAAEKNKNIRLIKVWVDAESGQKFEENELTLSEVDTFCSKREKIGIPLHAIVFIDWNPRQPPYYRQRLYPKKGGKPLQNDALLGSETRVMERIGYNKDKDRDKNKSFAPSPESFSSFSPLPSSPSSNLIEGKITIKEEFFGLLRSYRGYPFSESLDSVLFSGITAKYPKINILEQTRKKIAWWKEHPDALKAEPRKQLADWLEEEGKFKNRGGPQPVGELIPEMGDADKRNFLMGLVKPLVKKKAEGQDN